VERVREKIEKLLLIWFLILIPTQIGKHFWPEWSQVMGLRIDYLSPVLYVVDIIWIGMFLSRGLRTKKINREKLFSFGNLVIIAVVVINIILAKNRWIAGYKWLRLGQWWWTVWYLKTRKDWGKEILLWVIPVWVTVEVFLGLGQLIWGGSLGGIFYWLGERRFALGTVGIARMNILNESVLRAYGTFSHPNSLAGFLLVSMGLWWWIRKKREINKLWWWGVWWMMILGIVISGSRWVWFLGWGSINWWLFWQKNVGVKRILGTNLVLLGAVILVLAMVNSNYRLNDFFWGWDKGSLDKRAGLNMVALKMIWNRPWFGVGAGNFLTELPNYQRNNASFWLQPVHNIILLGLAEIGMVGMIMFLGITRKMVDLKKWLASKERLMLMGMVLLTGMTDHFWVTLPQNSWLLAVMLGLV